MKFQKNILFFILSALLLSCKTEPEQLFSTVPAEHSNLYFENWIAENEQYNVYDYHNLYNGGGIAVIDINNDGLQDLYFTGNQVYDKLYLNKGDFVFEDISQSAGIQSSDWSTGVSVVDINQDGFLDLYVCKSGNETAENRANHLYINNGNLSFTEMAADFGLADTTHTNHSAFFDFDHDGDLDVYLLTTSNDIRNPNLLHEKDRYGLYARDRLYVNDGKGKFSEEGLRRGINQNNHGLGLAIADINQDGWEDILASSDFLPNDLVYLNNQDGTFSHKSSEILPYQSRFSMGNDIADLNNDGLLDIMTVDMLPASNEQQKKMLMTSYHVFEVENQLGYELEFTRNMLFLNQGIMNGEPQYTEIGLFTGVASTDWSWAPLIVDFDNDGLKDIAVSNGYLRDVTDSDFVSYNMSFAEKTKSKEEMRAFMNNNAASLPHLKAKNQFFRQTGNLEFKEVTDQWTTVEKGFTNGAVIADLDNDGDFDYITHNINEPIGLFRNNSRNNYLKIKLKGLKSNSLGSGAKIEFDFNHQIQTALNLPVRGYQSSVDPSVIFGTGDEKGMAKVRVVWPSGKVSELENIEINQTIVIDEELAKEQIPSPDGAQIVHFSQSATEIIYQENRFIDYYTENLLLQKYSAPGPAVAVSDIDKDGLDEVFVGGNPEWPSKLYAQNETADFQVISEQLINNEDADALFFDANADGYPDLYRVKGSNEVRSPSDKFHDELFINDGDGGFLKARLPVIDIPGSKILAGDFDQDGDLDLFRFGAVLAGNFPSAAKSMLLANDGKGNFAVTDQFDLGLITDAVSADFNKDGRVDILAVGHYSSPKFLINSSAGFKETEYLPQLKGLWNSVTVADLDADGDDDVILGNVGRNYRYPFGVNKPVKVYQSLKLAGFLITYFKDGLEVPVATRDDLIRQFPGLRSKFPNYASYAKVTIDDLRDVFDQQIAEINTMESGVLWNDGNGFLFEPLPSVTQQSVVNSILVKDINNDKLPDLVIAGNSRQFEPTNSGFIEGSLGQLLINNGKGQWKIISNQETGLWLKGETRNLIEIKTKKGSEILAARFQKPFIRFNFNIH
ncbi:VCBS repeat-containing protein [Jiulongibacter sediminis]|uniref:VCBS repeat-containing protein n=1 Tax=Jiulongibacter sediminis TaxID=1605367 RepID=UPI0026EC2E7D|nr:VCBS repeat-containing protein [Jiulongibacter sediminis]